MNAGRPCLLLNPEAELMQLRCWSQQDARFHNAVMFSFFVTGFDISSVTLRRHWAAGPW